MTIYLTLKIKIIQLTVVSAHRTPERMYSYAQSAKDRGIKTIIAGAGGAAHLPGFSIGDYCLLVCLQIATYNYFDFSVIFPSNAIQVWWLH